MAQGIPAAEVTIDEPLLRGLLAEQHADLAGLPLTLVDTGWDNEMWQLGDDLCLRLPRRAVSVSLLVNEQKWLPRLAPHLPLPVPAPVRVGVATDAYPWPWSIGQWLPGAPANRGWPNASEAVGFAEFLKALHAHPIEKAPANAARDQSLASKTDAIDERLARLRSLGSWISPGIEQAWADGLAASVSDGKRFIHGDLHPRNVLTERGCVSGVIDWGDMCAGDPATDLAAGWTLFEDREARLALLDAYGADTDLRARARGWGVFFGVLLLDSGLAGHAEQVEIGKAILNRVNTDRPHP